MVLRAKDFELQGGGLEVFVFGGFGFRVYGFRV